jgi:hypothetical protein
MVKTYAFWWTGAKELAFEFPFNVTVGGTEYLGEHV